MVSCDCLRELSYPRKTKCYRSEDHCAMNLQRQDVNRWMNFAESCGSYEDLMYLPI
jgi:hypothetical protein